MGKALETEVHDILESIKQDVHEHFGPEVGNVVTKIVDDAHQDVAGAFSEADAPAAPAEVDTPS